MSPEEAHKLKARIETLRSIGEDLLRDQHRYEALTFLGSTVARYRSEARKEDSQYRLAAWLGSVSSLIKTEFTDNPALVARSELLLPAPDSPNPPLLTPYGPTPKPPSKAVPPALDLLVTAKDYIFVDTISSASDPLRHLIETTLREDFYKSFPFRILMGALALATVVIFGGTIYSQWQVQGIAARAAEALKAIDSAKQDVVAKIDAITSRIQQEAQNEANKRKGSQMYLGYRFGWWL
jgi:hypothetical protein